MGIGKTCAAILWEIGHGKIVQLRRLTFLNGLCGSLNEVICQCYSWYRRGKNFTKLCNEYNIVGSSPLIFDVFAKFRPVCESWLSLISCIVLDIDLSVCQSVFLHFLCFICLPEWWINVYISEWLRRKSDVEGAIRVNSIDVTASWSALELRKFWTLARWSNLT